MTPLLVILCLVLGALIGAGTVALCVAAASGDRDADVARLLADVPFSNVNSGRDVQLSVGDFNRLARMAANGVDIEVVQPVSASAPQHANSAVLVADAHRARIRVECGCKPGQSCGYCRAALAQPATRA